MTKLVIKLVAALIAALIGMPTAAAALPATPGAGSYIYDSQLHVAQPVTTDSERGPPKTSYDLKTGAYAVDRWSHGASPRPEELASGSTTAYTTLAGFVRVARATEAGVQGDARTLSALTRSDVAAKTETELVQRWMSQAELDATRSTGLVRGGRDGTHYVTDFANHDPLRARQRLALPQTPEVRVQLEVPRGVFSPPKTVRPDFNMPGGGLERTATGPVQCRVVCVWD